MTIDDPLRTSDGQHYRWPPYPAPDFQTFERATHLMGDGIPAFFEKWYGNSAADVAVTRAWDCVGHLLGGPHIDPEWWASEVAAAEKKDYWRGLDRVKAGKDNKPYYVPKLEKMSRSEQLKKYIAEAAPRIRDSAADRGTNVHDIFELLQTGEPIEFDKEHQWLMPWVDNCLDFLQTIDPTIVLSEYTIFNLEHNYAGRGDLIAYVNGRLASIDLKTSASGVYPKVGIQLALYDMPGSFIGYADGTQAELPVIEDYYVLNVTDVGWALDEVVVDDDVRQSAIHAIAMAHWTSTISKKVIGKRVAGTLPTKVARGPRSSQANGGSALTDRETASSPTGVNQ